MRLRTLLLPALLVASVHPALAQQARTRRTHLAAQTPAQQVTQLRFQWEALFSQSIANAKQHGESAAEYGASLGRIAAPGWATDLTPQSFVRTIHPILRLYGLTCEVTEDTPDRAVYRYKLPDVAHFTDRGVITREEYADAMAGMEKEIAAGHQLLVEHRAEEPWVVVTVTRR